MSKAPSPYSIETLQGTLELSKGAYLTMMKRKKNSTVKTIAKSKIISHANNLKATLKKSKKMHASYQPEFKGFRSNLLERSCSKASTRNITKSMMLQSVKNVSCIKNDVTLWDNNRQSEVGFPVWDEHDLFNIKGIPFIEMEGDNDEESTWEQVYEHGQGMSMALSVAAYDRTYGN